LPPGGDFTLEQYLRNLAPSPLDAQPGAQCRYGPSSIVQVRLIEVVTGQPLADALHERIFPPLRMVDALFVVSEDKRARIAPNCARTARQGPKSLQPDAPRPRFIPAGGNLCSTAADYITHLRTDPREQLVMMPFTQLAFSPTDLELRDGFHSAVMRAIGDCCIAIDEVGVAPVGLIAASGRVEPTEPRKALAAGSVAAQAPPPVQACAADLRDAAGLLRRRRRGRRERLALLDDVDTDEPDRGRAFVLGVVHHPGGDHEAFAGCDLAWRLAGNHQRRLSFGDIADFIARMRVPTGHAARRDLDTRNHRFAARHRHVGLGDHRARERRSLRDDDAGTRDERETGDGALQMSDHALPPAGVWSAQRERAIVVSGRGPAQASFPGSAGARAANRAAALRAASSAALRAGRAAAPPV
jgi:hypothetical protein